MIKNERLITTMTLRERIRLLAGSDTFQSSTLDTFEFPILSPVHDPLADADVFATRFPSERALAASFNSAVVKSVYKCVGSEARAAIPYAYFNVSNRPEQSAVSMDTYVTARYLADKVCGLTYGNAFVNFDYDGRADDAPTVKESVALITDDILKDNLPNSVLVHDEGDCKRADDSLLYGTASTKEAFVRLLNKGCVLVFLTADIFEDLVPYVTGLTQAYARAKTLFEAGRVDAAEFERRKEALEILDPDVIDRACDRLIDTFIAMKRLHGSAADEKHTLADPAKPHDPLFDEKLHDRIALEAARQSVVLLKNAGVLPLKSKDRIAVVGECAKNAAYAAWGNTATVTRLPFDAVNDYDIKTVGYAHGYLRGESGRTDLPNTAGILCSEADYALVWLCAEQNEYRLPDGQLELIDALYKRGIKIIAAVEADGIIDMSFAEKCAAVLFAYRGGQRVADAIYEIIAGKTCPSGRLTEPFPVRVEESEGEAVGSGGVLYPFGYGLSYTEFAYSNLKITDAGASCTVTNKGACDGYETVFLFVQKYDEKTGSARKVLRGYQKVLVKKNDAVKVFIPFDEGTFRTYCEKKKKFRVEGGKYCVYLASNGSVVKLAGELTLAEQVYDDESFVTEKEQPIDFDKAYGEFTVLRDLRETKRRKVAPFGIKVLIALMIALYVDALAFVCATGELFDDAGVVRWLVPGAVAFIADLIALIYIIKSAKQRTPDLATRPAKWNEVVDALGDFREIAKVSYEEPTKEEEKESPLLDNEAEEASAATDDEPLSYDNAFAEKGVEDIEFQDGVSFGELCNDFKRFMNARGVEIEMPSVRAIFAALSASHLVLMHVKNKEMLADFMDALSMYFNDAALMNASNDWTSPADVLWMKSNGKYVASPLLDAVYSAIANPNKNGMAIINNVSSVNLLNYFSDFARFALHPTEEHVLKANDTNSAKLPANMRYILIMQEEAQESVPKYLANASVWISPAIGKTSIEGTRPETLSFSRPTLDRLVQDARDDKFLAEGVWKKIDALAEAVGASEKFVIGNKNTLQLEKFTSVLLECGAEEDEALLGAFLAKLVPLLKTTALYAAEGGENTIFGMIEKLFPDEELSKVQRALGKTVAVPKEEAE